MADVYGVDEVLAIAEQIEREGGEVLAELIDGEHEHVAHLPRLLKYGKW